MMKALHKKLVSLIVKIGTESSGLIQAARRIESRMPSSHPNPFSHLPRNGSRFNLDTSSYVLSQAEADVKPIKWMLGELSSVNQQSQYDELDVESRLTIDIANYLVTCALYGFTKAYSGAVAKKVIEIIQIDESTLNDTANTLPSKSFKVPIGQVEKAVQTQNIEGILNACQTETNSNLKGISSQQGKIEQQANQLIETSVKKVNESALVAVQKYQVLVETLRKLAHQIAKTFIRQYLHTHPELKQGRFSFANTLEIIRQNQDSLRLTSENISQMVSQIIVTTKHPCESLDPKFLIKLTKITEMMLGALEKDSFNTRAMCDEMVDVFKLPHFEIRRPPGERRKASLQDLQERIIDWGYLQRDGGELAKSRFNDVFQRTPVKLAATKQEESSSPTPRITFSHWGPDVDGDFLVNSETLRSMSRQQFAKAAELYRTSGVMIEAGKQIREMEAELTTMVRDDILTKLSLESSQLKSLSLVQLVTTYEEQISGPLISAILILPEISDLYETINSKLSITHESLAQKGYPDPQLLVNDLEQLNILVQKLKYEDPNLKGAQKNVQVIYDRARFQGYMNCSGQHRQEGVIFLTIIQEMLRPFMQSSEFKQVKNDIKFWLNIFAAVSGETESIPEPLQRLQAAAQYHKNIFDYAFNEIVYFAKAPLLTDENYMEYVGQFTQAVCRQEVKFLGDLCEGAIHPSAIDTVIVSQNDTGCHLTAAKILVQMAGLKSVRVGPLGENRKALQDMPGEIAKIEDGRKVVEQLSKGLIQKLEQAISSHKSSGQKQRSLAVYGAVESWLKEHQFKLLFLYQLGYSDNGKLVGAIGAKDGLNTCIKSLYEVLNKQVMKLIMQIASDYLLPSEIRKIEVFCSRLQTFLGVGTSPGRSGGLVNFGATQNDIPNLFRQFSGKFLGHLMWTIQGNAKTFNQLHAALWATFLEEILSAQAQSIIDYLLNGETKSPVLNYLGDVQKDKIEEFIFGKFLPDYGLEKDESTNKLDFLTYFNLFLNGALKYAKTGLRPSFRSVPKDADDNRAIGTQIAQLAGSFNYTMLVGVDLEGAFSKFGGPKGFAKQLGKDEHLRLTIQSVYYQLKMADWPVMQYNLSQLMADPNIKKRDKQVVAAYYLKMVEAYETLTASFEKIPNFEERFTDKWNLDRIENARMHNRRWRIRLIDIGVRMREVERQLAIEKTVHLEKERSQLVDEIFRVGGAIKANLWVSG